jgi:hypothetical protein
MYENVRCPSKRRTSARVEVSLGFLTSIALSLDECEVWDKTLLDHTVWRVEGEPIARIATEPVRINGKIQPEQLDAIIDEVIPYALQQLGNNPFNTIRSKVFGAAYGRSRSERMSGVVNSFRIRSISFDLTN